MNKLQVQDLGPGQVGKLVYLQERYQWILPHDLSSRGWTLVPLIPPVETVEPALKTTLEKPPGVRYAWHTKRACRALVQNEPNLGPALDLLPNLEQVSVAASAAGDANLGERLSVGRIYDRRSHERVGLAAVVAGPSAEVLRLEPLERSYFNLNKDDQCLRYVSWTLGEAKPGWWTEYADPIYQVVFSQSTDEYGEILAVRRQRRIALLRPYYRENGVSRPHSIGTDHPSSKCPASRIEPNKFGEIIANSRDANFAHVAFNPWDSKQAGVIDESGKWSIWALNHESSPERTQKHPKALFKVQPGAYLLAGQDCDGWAKIVWVKDPQTVLVARRRNVFVFSLRSTPRQILVPSPVDLHNTSDWIVDVQRSSVRPEIAFVLTSSRLVTLILTEETALSTPNEGGQILLSIPHPQIRGRIDISMSLTAIDQVIVILVHTRGKRPSIVHTLRTCVNHMSLQLLSTSLLSFGQSEAGDSPMMSDKSSSFALDTSGGVAVVPCYQDGDIKNSGFESAISATRPMLRLFACSANLGISESLLSFQDLYRDEGQIELVPARSRSASLVSSILVDEDFIVEDASLSDDPDASSDLPATRHFQIGLQKLPLIRLIRDNAWQCESSEIQWTHFVQAFSSTSALSSCIDDMAVGKAELMPGCYTLADILPNNLSRDQFDELLPHIGRLLHATRMRVDYLVESDGPTTLVTTALPTNPLSMTVAANISSVDAKGLYDYFSGNCIAALDDEEPATGRIGLSKVLRHVAIKTFLAAYQVTIISPLYQQNLIEHAHHLMEAVEKDDERTGNTDYPIYDATPASSEDLARADFTATGHHVPLPESGHSGNPAKPPSNPGTHPLPSLSSLCSFQNNTTLSPNDHWRTLWKPGTENKLQDLMRDKAIRQLIKSRKEATPRTAASNQLPAPTKIDQETHSSPQSPQSYPSSLPVMSSQPSSYHKTPRSNETKTSIYPPLLSPTGKSSIPSSSQVWPVRTPKFLRKRKAGF